MREGLAVVLLLVLLAPCAAAQASMRLDVTPLSGPQPVVRNLTAEAVVTVPCSLLVNGSAPGSLSMLDAPSWLEFDANATRFTVGPCGADPQVARVNVTVRISTEAPAQAAANARLVAHVGAHRAEASFPVVADVFTLVDVQAERTVLEGKPQSVLTFPIHLRNEGNGITRVTVEIGAVPEGWIVIKPQPVTLQSRQAGGFVTEGTVNIAVQTPHRFGMVNEVAQIPVWINATPALGNGAADRSNVTLTAKVQGLDTPSPPLGLLVPALVVVALWVRRR